MKTPFALTLMTGIALALAPAVAQDASGQTPAAQTAPSASGTMPAAGLASDVSTETFIPMAASSNQFEIQSSELALQQAQDQQVKDLAQHMIDEHTAMGERMKEILQSAGVQAPAGEALDPRHQQMLDTLASSQSNFDQAYVKAQQQAHQEAVQLFSAYAESGDQDQIVTFAQESLPRLKQHLQMVQQLPGATVDATSSTATDPASIPENDNGLGANTQPQSTQ